MSSSYSLFALKGHTILIKLKDNAVSTSHICIFTASTIRTFGVAAVLYFGFSHIKLKSSSEKLLFQKSNGLCNCM